MPGNKYTAANSLSRRLRTEFNNINKGFKVNINNFIKVELNVVLVSLILAAKQDNIE